MDHLDDHLGRFTDIDGFRYYLAGLNGRDAILTDPDSDAGTDPNAFIRKPADYLAGAMGYLPPGTPHNYRP